jgi:hypothetical protein
MTKPNPKSPVMTAGAVVERTSFDPLYFPADSKTVDANPPVETSADMAGRPKPTDKPEPEPREPELSPEQQTELTTLKNAVLKGVRAEADAAFKIGKALLAIRELVFPKGVCRTGFKFTSISDYASKTFDFNNTRTTYYIHAAQIHQAGEEAGCEVLPKNEGQARAFASFCEKDENDDLRPASIVATLNKVRDYEPEPGKSIVKEKITAKLIRQVLSPPVDPDAAAHKPIWSVNVQCFGKDKPLVVTPSKNYIEDADYIATAITGWDWKGWAEKATADLKANAEAAKKVA